MNETESATEPFRIEIADGVLDDLAARLRQARLPPAPIGEDERSVARRIQDLIGYWRDGYDWRAQERRLNALPQLRATVDGVGLHVVHVPGVGPDPLPLLLTNGWPSSFVEYLAVADRLADPARDGGDPADAFSVVIPALPGYGFSDRGLDRTLTRVSIAGLFNRLMVEHLGYPRYVAHGDDIGGGVVNRLGLRHADSVIALQTANPIGPYLGAAPDLTPAEQEYQEASRVWDEVHGAYAHVQATRPWTLAFGLNDSPLGLAAWILEKWLTWSDPATRDRLSADDLISTVMVYWVTETIGSSVRLYAPATALGLGPDDRITVPTSVLAPHEPDLPVPPESWLRRAYPSLRRFVSIEEGGHFLALENPDQFVTELRTAFRPYRATR